MKSSKKITRLSQQAILKTLEKYRPDIRRYKVKKIGLFGSFTKGTAHYHSDIDILVKFDEPTFDNYMDLKFLLEKLFHRKVDLVMEDNLKKELSYVKKEAHYVRRL